MPISTSQSELIYPKEIVVPLSYTSPWKQTNKICWGAIFSFARESCTCHIEIKTLSSFVNQDILEMKSTKTCVLIARFLALSQDIKNNALSFTHSSSTEDENNFIIHYSKHKSLVLCYFFPTFLSQWVIVLNHEGLKTKPLLTCLPNLLEVLPFVISRGFHKFAWTH